MNADYTTMIKLLRQNRVDKIMALLDDLHACEPARITRVELYYLHKLTVPYETTQLGPDEIYDWQSMMDIFTTTPLDDARLSIPPELARYFRSRSLLYAFVCTYFPAWELFFYYRAAPAERAEKGIEFMRELVYLVVMRFDMTVKARLAGIADEQLRALGRDIAALPPTEALTNDAIPEIPERWPDRSPSPDIEDDEPDALNEQASESHRSVEPRGPREETAALIIQGIVPTSLRRPPPPPPPVRRSAQSNRTRLRREDQAWMQKRWALARRTPTLLPEMVLSGAYAAAVADVLPRAALMISHIIERPGTLFYTIAEMYNILSFWNEEINPTRGEGVYLYLRFFTLTHLRMVVADVEADVRHLVKEDDDDDEV